MASVTLSKKASATILFSVIIGVSTLFTVFSDNITEYAVESLKLCALSVIPSLFPFMVLSSIAAKSAPHLANGKSRGTAIILSVILGTLCGFPVGAATVAAMYKNGSLQRVEAEHLCALCNNTGPAFVIGVIGLGFWGNRIMGVMFYICQIIAAGIVFCIWRILFYRRRTDPAFGEDRESSSNAKDNDDATYTSALSNTARVFCTSVSESAFNVISICGYIVFFKVICDTLSYFMPAGPASKFVYSIITSVIEFTSGTQNAALHGGLAGVALCGFAIGFSGISVMAQSTGILSKAGLSAKPLFIMKLFVGAISAMLCAFAYNIFDFGDTVTFRTYTNGFGAMLNISIGIVVLAVIMFVTDRLLAKR